MTLMGDQPTIKPHADYTRRQVFVCLTTKWREQKSPLSSERAALRRRRLFRDKCIIAPEGRGGDAAPK